MKAYYTESFRGRATICIWEKICTFGRKRKGMYFIIYLYCVCDLYIRSTELFIFRCWFPYSLGVSIILILKIYMLLIIRSTCNLVKITFVSWCIIMKTVYIKSFRGKKTKRHNKCFSRTYFIMLISYVWVGDLNFIKKNNLIIHTYI